MLTILKTHTYSAYIHVHTTCNITVLPYKQYLTNIRTNFHVLSFFKQLFVSSPQPPVSDTRTVDRHKHSCSCGHLGLNSWNYWQLFLLTVASNNCWQIKTGQMNSSYICELFSSTVSYIQVIPDLSAAVEALWDLSLLQFMTLTSDLHTLPKLNNNSLKVRESDPLICKRLTEGW